MQPFSLSVPADERFRVLATEMAAKYAELLGGTAADGAAITASLGDAMTRVTGDAADGAVIALAFQPGPEGVEVAVSCGEQSAVVKQAVMAPKK